MNLSGILFGAVVIGLYGFVALGFFLLAWVARSRKERRTAEVLFGSAAWLLVAPALALWFCSSEVHTIEHPVLIRYSWDEAALIDDPGRAFLIAFAITSPLILVPVAHALFRRRRSGSTALRTG
jgi:hypothetical protein